MRNLLVSALVSSIVALSIVMAFHFSYNDGMRDNSTIPMVESATANSASESQFTSLKNEIELIRNRMNRYEAASGDQESLIMFDKRIAQIELALDELPSNASRGGAKNGQIAPQRMSERMDQTREVIADQARQQVEAQFESDSGLPLGDFGSSIEDAIQQVDGIQAQGIDCRNTICKVSYASGDVSGSEDLDWQIMEQLLERSGGRQVDVRYANDSFGNSNMYIQLN